MKILLSRILLVLILPVIDYYVFRKIKNHFPGFFENKKNAYIYWTISIFLIGFMLVFSVIENYKFREFMWPVFTTIVVFILIVFAPKAIAALFFLISDFFGLFLNKNRRAKLGKIMLRIIFVLVIITEIIILSGVFYGRFNFKVLEKEVVFCNLPEKFDNYRIVHLSDLHLGSFVYHRSRIIKIVEIVNSLEPDLIVFTGDLVNNTTQEAWRFIDILKNLSSPDGIIAVTGNHDYGTYVNWNCAIKKEKNFLSLKQFYDSIGAALLLNENIALSRGEQRIFISGIESSGIPPFDKLGDVEQALYGISEDDFVIMLSHDPSFWRNELLNFSEIDLTLSGHTHSMQLGIYSERLNFKWSPVKWLYSDWHGKYKENGQKLIINSGAGYIAMPARIGAPPEIGLIVLRNTAEEID